MPKKTKTTNQFVTSKEFNETRKEFIERFDKIENKMATKDDISRLAKGIIKNGENIKSIKDTMPKNEDIQRIIITLDAMRGQTEDHGRKAEINTHRIKEIEPKADDHERRIGKLESQRT